MSMVEWRQVDWKQVELKEVTWRDSNDTTDFPRDLILYMCAKDGLKNQIGNQNPFASSVLGPQYVRAADGSYTNAGAVAPVDVIGGRKMLRTCGAVQNLFSGDTSITRSVTLTAQKYTLQVFGAGSVTCSYGTATVGNPLTFTAIVGSVTFTPTGATLWMLTASAYPLPYTPPGTTMPASHATTTNGPWFSLPQYDDAEETKVNKVWAALTGSPMTLAWRGVMGAGSADLPNSTFPNILRPGDASAAPIMYYEKSAGGTERALVVADGVQSASINAAWLRNEGSIKVAQINAAGTQLRAGVYRVGIDTSITWSNWSNFDGSFNPTTLYKLVFGFSNIYPLWHDTIAIWNKQIDDATLLKEMLK